MPGLDPGIHRAVRPRPALRFARGARHPWIAGVKPAMTNESSCRTRQQIKCPSDSMLALLPFRSVRRIGLLDPAAVLHHSNRAGDRHAKPAFVGLLATSALSFSAQRNDTFSQFFSASDAPDEISSASRSLTRSLPFASDNRPARSARCRSPRAEIVHRLAELAGADVAQQHVVLPNVL